MIELKNSFIFAPIKLGYSEGDGLVNSRHLSFYEERSRYLGAVTIEPLYMDKGLREIPTQLGIDKDDKIEGLQKLTESIHKSGTKVIAHLNHPGRMANPKISDNYFVSSTDKPCKNGGAIPKRMNLEDMDKAINIFVAASKRVKESNFDIIELQFGHGYLLAQFISPLVNDRTDEYGGNFENMIKFPLQVLQAVKESVDLPVIARLSGDEMLPDGIKLQDMINFSKVLEKNGVDAIHVSAGSVCSTPPWYFQHMFIPKGKTWEMAKKISQNINTPVIYVGKINTFEDIENIKNNYSADYIAIGRGLVADPDFLGKYLGEEEGIQRPCLACAEGCLGGVKSGEGLQCVVNPTVGKQETTFEVAETHKNFAVVGGGLAGMEASLTLHRRGHKVTLFEKDKLGGQFNLAYLPPHKETLKKLIDYYVTKLNRYEIPVIYKEPQKENLQKFDEIVIATGSKPAIPPIQGLEEYYWAEVLEERNIPENKRVVVIGGGLIGTEIANKLLSKGNKVFIVEMLSEIARGMEMIEQKLVLKALQNENVNIFVDTTVKSVQGDKVMIEGVNVKQTLDNIDIIVLATGMKKYNPYENVDFDKPVHVVGDAKEVGKAKDAIKDAYETAKEL
jgi:2,4-dienoyl-CoA reductase (NADPH2)